MFDIFKKRNGKFHHSQPHFYLLSNCELGCNFPFYVDFTTFATNMIASNTEIECILCALGTKTHYKNCSLMYTAPLTFGKRVSRTQDKYLME